MNLLAYDSPAQHKPPPAEEWRILNFDATRAGRAVANAASITVGAHVRDARWNEEMLLGPLDLISGLHRTWDDDALALLVGFGSTVDMPRVPTAEDDPDADLVRWFAEGQAEAEESMQADKPSAKDAPEPSGEVILTRRSGPRSRSWRGGGTMHRR